MSEFTVNMNELEKQRYKAIKDKGEYLEINILIGTEKENYRKGVSGKLPVVTTSFHNCGSEEIAAAYLVLKELQKDLEANFPMECLLSDIAMSAKNMGSIKIKPEEDKSED